MPEHLSILYNVARALSAQGETTELQTLFEESKTLPPQSGYSPGIIMAGAARELRAHGFMEDSVRVLGQAEFVDRVDDPSDRVVQALDHRGVEIQAGCGQLAGKMG